MTFWVKHRIQQSHETCTKLPRKHNSISQGTDQALRFSFNRSHPGGQTDTGIQQQRKTLCITEEHRDLEVNTETNISSEYRRFKEKWFHYIFSLPQKTTKQTKADQKNQHTTTYQLVPSRELPTAIQKQVTKTQRFPRQSRVHATFLLNV